MTDSDRAAYFAAIALLLGYILQSTSALLVPMVPCHPMLVLLTWALLLTAIAWWLYDVRKKLLG